MLKQFWLLVLLFAVGCVQPQSFPQPLYSINYSFASEQLLVDHWNKHGNEFGKDVSKTDYLRKARIFFNDTSKEKERKHRSNGDELQYKPSTNEFGVLSRQKVIRTFFRPSSGRRYWERQ